MSMTRAFAWCVALCLLAPAGAWAGQGGGRSAPDGQAVLRQDMAGMMPHLVGARVAPQQIIADAQALSRGYRSLGPYARGFGPADYAINRQIARQSLDWLGRASVLYGRDPLVAQAVLLSYESIGGFYRDYGTFYHPGAFVAFAGATRLAQRLVLAGLDADRYERDLNRYALAYGSIAALNGAYLIPWNRPYDLPDVASAPTEPTVVLKQVELPAVNAAELDAEQKTAWADVKDRFRSVAPRVHQARVLLNELSGRLQRQRMSLNAEDAASALKMQSYLEDAVDLVKEKQFEMATEALTRAEYVRVKLKGVTGQ